MSERPKERASKARVGVTQPWVQIPPPPPLKFSNEMVIRLMKKIFVTAGFGLELEAAAARLENQAISTHYFDEVIKVTLKNFEIFCPKLLAKYPEIFNTNTKGFGYYSWKSEILCSIFEKYNQNDTAIFYLDAGCEINSRKIPLLLLKKFNRSANINGFFGYKLNTDERSYTKKKVRDLFSIKNDEFQVQATWFIVSGEKGYKLVQSWLNLILSDLTLIDSSIDEEKELPEFIEHRWDQSLLSLLVKNNHFEISDHKPPSGKGKFKSRFKALFFPIWSARNRTGKSNVPIKGSIEGFIKYVVLGK